MLVSPTIHSVHGRIRSIHGTDPAAGVEISEVVPARRRWIIHSLIFSFTTNANVADRSIRLEITDGTTIIYRHIVKTPQPASSTDSYSYSWQPVVELNVSAVRIYSLPPIPLGPGYVISTATINKDAGDDFTAPQLLIEEWIDP